MDSYGCGSQVRITRGLFWEERSEEEPRRFAWPYWLTTAIRTSLETNQPSILYAKAGWMWGNSSSISEVRGQSWWPHQKKVLNCFCRSSLRLQRHPRPVVRSTENSANPSEWFYAYSDDINPVFKKSSCLSTSIGYDLGCIYDATGFRGLTQTSLAAIAFRLRTPCP